MLQGNRTSTRSTTIEIPSPAAAETAPAPQPSFPGQGRRLGRAGTTEASVHRQSEEHEAVVRLQIERLAIVGREIRYRALLQELPQAPIPEPFQDALYNWLESFLTLERNTPDFNVLRQRMLSILIFRVLRPSIQSTTLDAEQRIQLLRFMNLIEEILQYSLPAGTSVGRFLLNREIALREGRILEHLGEVVERSDARQREELRDRVTMIHGRMDRSFVNIRAELMTLVESRRNHETRAVGIVNSQVEQVEQIRTILIARGAQINALHDQTPLSEALRSSLQECLQLMEKTK